MLTPQVGAEIEPLPRAFRIQGTAVATREFPHLPTVANTNSPLRLNSEDFDLFNVCRLRLRDRRAHCTGRHDRNGNSHKARQDAAYSVGQECHRRRTLEGLP